VIHTNTHPTHNHFDFSYRAPRLVTCDGNLPGGEMGEGDVLVRVNCGSCDFVIHTHTHTKHNHFDFSYRAPRLVTCDGDLPGGEMREGDVLVLV